MKAVTWAAAGSRDNHTECKQSNDSTLTPVLIYQLFPLLGSLRELRHLLQWESEYWSRNHQVNKTTTSTIIYFKYGVKIDTFCKAQNDILLDLPLYTGVISNKNHTLCPFKNRIMPFESIFLTLSCGEIQSVSGRKLAQERTASSSLYNLAMEQTDVLICHL